jgi:hypothetical protein
VSDADSNDFEDRFRRHFPRRSNDLTLVVLKGHLLLEEIVNRLLSALLREPKAIEGANLRFHQKLCLIRALLPKGRGDRLYNAAEKLNTLRNKLAHHLDYPEIEAQVRDFLSLCEEPEDPEEPDNRDKLPLSAASGSLLPSSAACSKERAGARRRPCATFRGGNGAISHHLVKAPTPGYEP